jgi:hypothetical protein
MLWLGPSSKVFQHDDMIGKAFEEQKMVGVFDTFSFWGGKTPCAFDCKYLM